MVTSYTLGKVMELRREPGQCGWEAEGFPCLCRTVREAQLNFQRAGALLCPGIPIFPPFFLSLGSEPIPPADGAR